jgi:ABC-type multidrug transport system ATPase subunit
MMELDILAAENVSKNFGRRWALSKISFEVRAGNIFGLLGPNGAGKSTMISVLATLLRPTEGTVRYGMHAIVGGQTMGDALDPALRSSIGMLGHDLFLYPELTARENLVFFGAISGESDPEEKASRALEQAGLSDRADDLVASLSRGMRQRTALERTLIHGPRLLLLDEPFTGLDDVSATFLVNRLQTLRKEGAIIVLATHDLDLAEGLLDKALFLRQGRAVRILDRPTALRATYRAVISGESAAGS